MGYDLIRAYLVAGIPYVLFAALVPGTEVTDLPDEIVLYHRHLTIVIVLLYHEQVFRANFLALAAAVAYVLIDGDAVVAAGVGISVMD
jgi:hypothetical protein